MTRPRPALARSAKTVRGGASVEIPERVVTAATGGVVFVVGSLVSAVVFLFKRSTAREDQDREEAIANARALRIARYTLERAKGLASSPPLPEADDEPSIVRRVHTDRNRRWIEENAALEHPFDPLLREYVRNGGSEPPVRKKPR